MSDYEHPTDYSLTTKTSAIMVFPTGEFITLNKRFSDPEQRGVWHWQLFNKAGRPIASGTDLRSGADGVGDTDPVVGADTPEMSL